MKLSRMWSVDRTANFETRRSAIADLIAERWGDDLTPKIFRSSANFIYLCEYDGQRAFLRFAHESERNRAGIQQEMELLVWLAGQQVAVNQPIHSRANALVETIETDIGAFHAVLLTGIAGLHHEFEQLESLNAQRWGAAIGSLHTALASAPGDLRRATGFWNESLDRACQKAQRYPAIVRREAFRLHEALAELPQNSETYGLIHCDLELDNVFDREGDFAYIDFDEYCSGWFAFDLAKAFSEGLGETAGEASPLFHDFVSGYRSVHALSEQMEHAIPVMLRLSNLNSYVRVKRSLDFDATADRVDWMANLERNLNAWAEDYEGSLLQFE